MSINIDALKSGNKITFSKYVTKEVRSIRRDDDGRAREVAFYFGPTLACDDTLWELAEIQKIEIPGDLSLAFLNRSGRYELVRYPIDYTPEAFLRVLREAVTTLEAAGVKVYDN